MSWIVDNKQWLFSGVGVAISTAIIGLVWRVFSHKRSSYTISPAPADRAPTQQILPQIVTTSSSAAAVPILQMSLDDILSDIQSRPPFQRDETIKHYIGTKVRFAGQMVFLLKKNDEEVDISIRPNDSYYPEVEFLVSVLKYPEFKVIKNGAPLVVEGRIIEIGYGRVQLEDVTVNGAA